MRRAAARERETIAVTAEIKSIRRFIT